VVGGAEDDDAALAARARRGDVDAYADLVRRHQHLAVRLAQVVAGQAAEAEDIAQDAFVKGYRRLDRFREGAPFRPWLLAIVANEARNRRRSHGRRRHHELRLADDRSLRGAGTAPEYEAVADDERHRLLAAVQALPARQRDVVACRYLLELSEAETAAVLGLGPGTVKSHLSRGLDRLRRELTDGD
jgi:RNA polymerase sigma-70 factor (ECF subfamily)